MNNEGNLEDYWIKEIRHQEMNYVERAERLRENGGF